MLKNPKGSTFQFFGLVRFFENLFFFSKGPPSTATKVLTISEVSAPFSASRARASGPRRATRSIFFGFSIFEYCKLTLGSPFTIFEPRIWRRLGPVPACSNYIKIMAPTGPLCWNSCFVNKSVLCWLRECCNCPVEVRNCSHTMCPKYPRNPS